MASRALRCCSQSTRHRLLFHSSSRSLPFVATRSTSTTSNRASWTYDGLKSWQKAGSAKKAGFSVLGGAILSVAVVGFASSSRDAAEDDDPRDRSRLSAVPLSKLVSGWSAFAFCSSPTWVDMSETMYKVVSSIPIVSSVAHVFIMNTFVNQFLGGEDIEDCYRKMEDLRKYDVGTLLGYNIEAELDGSSKDPELVVEQTRHVLDSIDAQGRMARQFGRGIAHANSSDAGSDNRCWARIKITGLLPHPIALQHAADAIVASRKARGLDKDVPHPGLPHDGDWEAAINGPGVTDSDREQMLSLRATMEAIASKAKDNKVRIVIDAEQSWYQPALDALTDELMQTYNKSDGGPPIIIASFQAYLRRHPQLIEQQIRRAEEKGYSLLFKQVRGAYMVTEASRAKEHGTENPVWSTKEETDASFNYGMRTAMSAIAQQIQETGSSKISAVFATHNSLSIDQGIESLKQHKLIQGTSEDGRLVLSDQAAASIAFAQLYGMKDDLTNKITGSITSQDGVPLVVKSMSYGTLKECMPFLARRATENKSVLEGRGGAVAERKRLGAEIRRRLAFWS